MKIKVHSVNSALNPNGEVRIGVTFTQDCPIPRVSELSPGKTTIQIEPGRQLPIPQTPRENRMVIFFEEKEWNKLKKKPNVGDEYTVNYEDDGKIVLSP